MSVHAEMRRRKDMRKAELNVRGAHRQDTINCLRPLSSQALVRQWCLDHQLAPEQNWTNAQALHPLSRIPGADND